MSVLIKQLAHLSISEVTPVIKALFGDFEGSMQREYNGTLLVACFEQDTNVSWDVVFTALKKLSVEMGLEIHFDGEYTTQYYKDVLMAFAKHFNVIDNKEFQNLIESHELEDDADFPALFTLAVAFDDGHGLNKIIVEQSIQTEDWEDVESLSFLEFGGASQLISRNCTFKLETSELTEFGTQLNEALEADDINGAAGTLAGMVNLLLDTVSSQNQKAMVRKALIEQLGL